MKFCAIHGHWDSQSPQHVGNPDLCPGSHLLTAQKPASECYVKKLFIRTIAEWSEYCALLDAVGELCIIRNS